jgi:hypothetical protein
MINYVKGFINRMGPIGFGLAVSSALLLMLGTVLGVSNRGHSFIVFVYAPPLAGAFGFFFTGTIALALRSALLTFMEMFPPKQ